MSRVRPAHSALALTIALAAALAALAALAWIIHARESRTKLAESSAQASVEREAPISESLAEPEGVNGATSVPRTEDRALEPTAQERPQKRSYVHASSRDARSGAAIPLMK